MAIPLFRSVADVAIGSDVMVPHTSYPRVTFQDTNIVGNVYFLTFFRWQLECRDAWLRSVMPDAWAACSSGEGRVCVSHWSNRFEDAFGATIGDRISVTLRVVSQDQSGVVLSSEVLRHDGEATSRLASGSMKLRMELATDDAMQERDACLQDIEDGPCYTMHVSTPVDRELNATDLLSWQGKCRELFLEDQAGSILRQVAKRELILQTTTASLEWMGSVPGRDSAVRVEMRLASLKCGQMGVRFDYVIDRSGPASKLPFAIGHQSMSSKHPVGETVLPCPLPRELLVALREFTDSPRLMAKIEDILRFAEPIPYSVKASELEAILEST